MAVDLTMSYAETATIKSRIDKTSGDDDTQIKAVALAISRVLDDRLGRPPGGFLDAGSAAARYFDGLGRRGFVLRDGRGKLHDLQALTSLKFDEDDDGTYEVTVPTGDVLLYPLNNDVVSRPFRELRLRTSGTTRTLFPTADRSVEVTATWGWDAVPEELVSLTVMLTHQLLNLEQSGITLSLQNIDEVTQMTPGAPTLLRSLEQSLGARLPAVA